MSKAIYKNSGCSVVAWGCISACGVAELSQITELCIQEMTAWNSAGSGILSAVELELNQSVSISFKIINLKNSY